MKCPQCVQNNEHSNVYPGAAMTTLLAYTKYYDDDGTYHDHDPNTISTQYDCSRGHSWMEKSKATCPNCDYGKP